MIRYCYFNGYNLNLENSYEITDVMALDQPELRVNKYKLARADGERVTSQYYGSRNVKVSGRILANSTEDMERKLDTFKTYLVGMDKDFDIKIAGSTRRFIATVTALVTDIVGYYCKFDITFTADALGKDLSNTALSFGTYATTPTSYSNVIGGTYKTKPYIDMSVSMIDPYWSAKYLQITNSVANQTIRLTRTWAWYDRVIIDGANKSVTLYPSTKTVIDACDVTTGWTSTHTLSLEATNMKQGVGALKVVMGAASSTTDFIRLNADAVSFASTVGKVILPIYIPTPSAGAVASVSFYIGKDATLAANYDYWTVSTQWDGSAIQTSAWNYIVVDMASAVTGTNGSPDRTAVKSLKVVINGTSAAMQLSGVYLDYITIQKPSVTGEALDYEGTFPDLALGTTVLTFSDELTKRSIVTTGSYIKRYL